ncbi:hypothetical protein GCM10011348_43840 [Marinobacterium nitratireducens]|uniref:Uncharacterized protein n=1 Tax=Marinobacterium nitratireducens TaxID=518897 RepID=A0A917ZR63_9GAMM|nr:hypothetical protein GCM10011348_43840 [Marinobacterium nitratireducens]
MVCDWHDPEGGSSSPSDLTQIYCGKADFGHFLFSFSLNRTTIRLKRAQKLPQNGLPLATIGQARQAASDAMPSYDSVGTGVGHRVTRHIDRITDRWLSAGTHLPETSVLGYGPSDLDPSYGV